MMAVAARCSTKYFSGIAIISVDFGAFVGSQVIFRVAGVEFIELQVVTHQLLLGGGVVLVQ